MTIPFLARNIRTCINAVTSSDSRKYLIELKQNTLYRFDSETKRFIEVNPKNFSVDKNKKAALAFFSNYDVLLSGTTEKFQEMKKLDNSELFICRWSDASKLSEIMELTKKLINPKDLPNSSDSKMPKENTLPPKKIDKLLFWGHGSKSFILIGSFFSLKNISLKNLSGRSYYILTESTLDKDVIENNIKEDGEIVLFSCNTGYINGLAQKISKKFANRKVIAATETITSMKIDEDKKIHLTHSLPCDGGVNLTILWENGKATAENKHDSFLLEIENRLSQEGNSDSAEILKELQSKKNELQSIQNEDKIKRRNYYLSEAKKKLKTCFSQLFSIKSRPLFPFYIVPIYLYASYFCMRTANSNQSSSVDNKLARVNELINNSTLYKNLHHQAAANS